METHNHEALKFKTLEWLYTRGCIYITTELKIGNYIYDVVGSDGRLVYIVEAKQSKQDFLKDCNNPIDIKKNIYALKEELKENSDIERCRDLIEKERNKSIKFFDEAVLKISSYRYIITMSDIIDDVEIPEKWGILNEEPRLIKKSLYNKIDYDKINKIIHKISKRNTKIFLKNVGFKFGEKVEFPIINFV